MVRGYAFLCESIDWEIFSSVVAIKVDLHIHYLDIDIEVACYSAKSSEYFIVCVIPILS